MTKLSPDEQLAEDLSGFYADPLGYVMYCFPWDTDRSIQQVPLAPEYYKRFPGARCMSENCSIEGDHAHGPDAWACEFLDGLGEDIKKRGFDGTKTVQPIRYSTVSGHGIGKGALTAWLVKFISDTRPFSKGVVTANTSTQLKTKTWAEVGKWHAISLTQHWFKYNAGRGNMSLAHHEHPAIWRCDANTCRPEDSEAFQGLHAANSTPYYIFDEASGIDKKIWSARAGGATDGEPMSFDFGNPTQNSGDFFENCEGINRHRYTVRKIDSRDVYITNKPLLKEWEEDNGIDSDWCKVKIRGMFPSMGNLQFISSEAVELAMNRDVPPRDASMPLLIGVDVARHGNNETVIYPRLGYDARSFPPQRYKGLDMVQVEGRIIETIHNFRTLGLEVAGLFIDEGGIGGGVVDHLRHYGYAPIGVQFGGRPTDNRTYRFKVDEIWGGMKADMSKLALPRLTDPAGADLRTQLTQREFGYTKAGDKINLEAKDDMQERLGSEMAAPDIADALATTWAQEMAPRIGFGSEHHRKNETVHEFDPMDARY